MRTWDEWMLSRGLNPQKLPSIAHIHEDSDLRKSYIEFDMKDLKTGNIIGGQMRFTNPEYQVLKSRTKKGSHVGWYREKITRDEPIIIVEGEVDFMTAYQNGWNVLGIQGVNNLNKTIDILDWMGIKKVIIFVDTDIAATNAIEKIQKRSMCYDGRYALGKYKDTNEARCAGELIKPEAMLAQNLYVKLGAFKIERSKRPMPDTSIDFLRIDTAEVLQNLYPQYTVKGDRIYDNGKLSDGYRYWKNQNAVVDFAGKNRPQGNAWSVAYSYYNDKKETAEYLKKYL